jgi:hypothetical protein
VIRECGKGSNYLVHGNQEKPREERTSDLCPE